MRDLTVQSRVRRTLLLLAPAALLARVMPAQSKSGGISPELSPPGEEPEAVRLPNGKKQQDEILKAEYEKNVKDAQELVSISKAFEEDLEKDDRFVLSISSLKKLDDIEKLTKRIRGRMKRY
jgi:hypothetical protein